MLDWVLEPLQYSFFVRALASAIIVGTVCAVLGAYIVLRGMAFFGDALAHTILPGVAIAFLIGWPLAIGALIFGVLTAIGIGYITERSAIKEDTAIGIVFAGLFALGVALLSAGDNYTVDLAHFLFGNLLGVSPTDLLYIGLLSGVVLLIIFLFYKEFLVISFDPLLAETLRLPATFLRYLLLILVALTVVISLQVVGIALMMAMLVTPAAAASLWTRRLPALMFVAAIIGALSGMAGLYSSFYLDIASGPAVVLAATLVFVVAFVSSPSRGMLRKRIR